jgi:hypothetical protein
MKIPAYSHSGIGIMVINATNMLTSNPSLPHSISRYMTASSLSYLMFILPNNIITTIVIIRQVSVIFPHLLSLLYGSHTEQKGAA